MGLQGCDYPVLPTYVWYHTYQLNYWWLNICGQRERGDQRNMILFSLRMEKMGHETKNARDL